MPAPVGSSPCFKAPINIEPRPVARNPQKLTDLLSRRGVSQPATSKLVILQGNGKDQDAVTKTLIDDSGKVVDKIVFGIGTYAPFSCFSPCCDEAAACRNFGR